MEKATSIALVGFTLLFGLMALFFGTRGAIRTWREERIEREEA
jgi:hypothetical protein